MKTHVDAAKYGEYAGRYVKNAYDERLSETDPVSYTHLDVYKRQLLAIVAICISLMSNLFRYLGAWTMENMQMCIRDRAKVVAMLREKGIEKSSLTREAFLRHAWEWKEKYGGVILKQLRKLGASCDLLYHDKGLFSHYESLFVGYPQ